MNPDYSQQLQDSMNKMDAIMHNFDSSPTGVFLNAEFWIGEHPALAWIISGIYFLIWLFSLWTCLRETKEIDRLTWLILILAVPFFGILFFWILFSHQTEEFAYPSYSGKPPPRPTEKTEREIADAVNASITEAIRKKRSY